MPIGIRDNCLQRPLLDALAAAGAIGFDGVEICLGREYFAHLLWEPGGVAKVLTACGQAGLTICSLSPGFYAQCHPLVDDESLRPFGHELITACIAKCGEVGADVVLVPMFPKDAADWSDGQWQTLIDGLRPLAETAGEAGVTLCFETTLTAMQLERLLDGVANPALRVYYDTANAVNWGLDGPAEIRRLGERIGRMHLKETGNLPLGAGAVDWHACREALRASGYDGWYVLETSPGEGEPIAVQTLNLGFTRGWLAA